jgi:chemotaxis protein MotA
VDIFTIIALISSFGLFLGAIFISTDNPGAFADLPSVIMVVGGATTAMFVSYAPRYVLLSLKLLVKIHTAPGITRNHLQAEVGRFIKWAYVVQKEGAVGLEKAITDPNALDPILKFGSNLVIAGYEGPDVRNIMDEFVDNTFNRNMAPVNIMKDFAAGAPAFGMVGTLVGLIIMLGNMGGSPEDLGAGLAVAMLTTLYGVIFARVIFLPAASKMQQREQIYKFRNGIVVEGFALLADKKSPRYIQDALNAFLDPAIHYDIDTMKDKSE